MPDASGLALLRLMTWLSPAFPIGGFSYSHGVERAVHDGLVTDRESLEDWLRALLSIGSGWNDAVLFSQAWRRVAERGDLHALAELGEALAGSEERHRETMLQGAAFLKACSGWSQDMDCGLPEDCPYAIATGAVCAAHRIPLGQALAAFLQAFLSNLLQASIRLGVIGQTGALETIAALESHILEVAARAEMADLDELGSATLMSEIVAMRHETQYSRLFRT